MAIVNPCDVLTTLSSFQQEVLDQLARHFNAIARLAEILEKVGDVTSTGDLAKIIPQLPPLSSLVSIDAYNQIRAACPMLNLPVANAAHLDSKTGADAVAKFQLDVARAYAGLLRKIDIHPFNRMGKLQARLDSVLAKAISAVGSDWFVCASIVCDLSTNAAFATTHDNIRQHLEINSQVAAGNLPPGTRTPFTVVSETGGPKVAQLMEQRSQLAQLSQSDNAQVQAIISRKAS